MAVNKVIFQNETIVDLTSDTVAEDKVLQGITFHKPNGELSTGTAIIPTGKVIEISTDAEMNAILDDENNVDKVYKFIGEDSSVYEKDTFYIVKTED